jgi:hypothetical protein
MKCNVCAIETRCYQLREITGHPGMMMQGEGMIFNICSPCLVKVLAPIKTDATTVETPEDIAMQHPRVAQVMDRIMQQHEMKKASKPPKEELIPKGPNP